MKLKTLSAILLCLMMIITFSMSAMASVIITKPTCTYPKPTASQLQSSMSIIQPLPARIEARGLLASISVKVSSPCDEEFRAYFPNDWMYQANQRVEYGDDPLYDWFGIDYLSVAQKEWQSDSIDDYDLYYEVIREWGKTNGASLMIAFSKQASMYGGLGASDGYALCWEFGLTYTSNTVSHESGHMYGVNVDGGCSTNCLMSGNPGEICDSCFAIWNGNKYNH